MNDKIRKRLIDLQARAKALTLFGNAPDGRSWNDHLMEVFMGTVDAPAEEIREYSKKLGDLYRRAHDKVPEAISELRGLVVETTQNFVTATTNFGSFFEVINLADNQAPAIVNTTRQEIKASYVGQDGKNELTKVIKPRNEVLVDLHELVSEEVEYRIRDIYTGDITEAARATFDVSFDLKQQLESKLFALLTDVSLGAFGAFDTTNANKAARTYQKHSRVYAGVLPTTNEIVLTDNGGATKFRFDVLKYAIDYALRFAGTEVDGDVKPTGDIIVPSQDITEIMDGITVISQKQSDIAEELQRQGWAGVQYGGYNWRFIPDNTIARKACYVRLSKPVGKLWFKPGMADMEETVDRKKNLASRWEKIVIAAAIPIPSKKNILRVTYRS